MIKVGGTTQATAISATDGSPAAFCCCDRNADVDVDDDDDGNDAAGEDALPPPPPSLLTALRAVKIPNKWFNAIEEDCPAPAWN